MFTGIIAGEGILRGRRSAGGGTRFDIEAQFNLDDPQEGESIAVNGVCLTAYNIEGRHFTADVSPETLSRSTLGGFAVGKKINLERALRLTDRLGGHVVSGHIDCVGEVALIEKKGDFTIFSFELPERDSAKNCYSRYVIEKGSIAIDGISLTVNSCEGRRFSVSIIPHTLEITGLGGLMVGSRVNLEVDIIGKYVEKLLGGGGDTASPAASKLTAAFLAENGFF